VPQPDLADLCLVRMSELYPRHSVLTVDRADFRVYRRSKRAAVPLICPPASSVPPSDPAGRPAHRGSGNRRASGTEQTQFVRESLALRALAGSPVCSIGSQMSASGASPRLLANLPPNTTRGR
jgi:hypothetical protein